MLLLLVSIINPCRNYHLVDKLMVKIFIPFSNHYTKYIYSKLSIKYTNIMIIYSFKYKSQIQIYLYPYFGSQLSMLKVFHSVHRLNKNSNIQMIYQLQAYFSTINQKKKQFNRANALADATLKNYFNLRNQLSNIQIIQLIDKIKKLKVTRSFFNDHRWIHLNVFIEKNMMKFSIKEQFRILQGLTKLKHYNDLFNAILNNLIAKIQTLTPNEKSHILYYMAKKQTGNLQVIKNICDSIIIDLNKQQMKVKFGRENKKVEAEQAKNNDEQQTLFGDLSIGENSSKDIEIDCRSLILCVWSLQKLRIKDPMLNECIIKTYLRPNMQNIPTHLFPLLMSTLWLKDMQNKRIFEEATLQIYKREKELLNLDRDKLKMLACMLCKPAIDKDEPASKESSEKKLQHQRQLAQIRKKLVLWLMQTLILKSQSGQQSIFAISAYQILANASEAGIVDQQIYHKYISLISEDLTKIENKQVVYLLYMIQKIRKNSKQKKHSRSKTKQSPQQQNKQPQFCENEHKILNDHLKQNILSFIHKIDQEHLSRQILRKMTLTNFIELPATIKKKFIHEERMLSQSKHKKGDPKAQSQQNSPSKPQNKASPLKKRPKQNKKQNTQKNKPIIQQQVKQSDQN